jgi:hypothetical protein
MRITDFLGRADNGAPDPGENACLPVTVIAAVGTHSASRLFIDLSETVHRYLIYAIFRAP